MGERALAHVERIKTTYPVFVTENDKKLPAEAIEMAVILDYHVVVKKGQFSPGDLAVYIEVDSILPQIPVFSFLANKKYTIKAMKFGQKFTTEDGSRIISQGILFHPSEVDIVGDLVEGLDVTEKLNITKVIENEEDDVSLKDDYNLFQRIDKKLMRFLVYRNLKRNIIGESIKGIWQPWMPSKSDEENIQKIYSRLYEKYGDQKGWYVSEKLEGSNASFYSLKSKKLFGLFEKTTYGVCSRTRNLITDDGSNFWNAAKKLNFEEKLKSTGKNLFCRGELIGPKIQKNIYKLTEYEIRLFEVFDIDNQRLYNYDEFLEFCEKYEFLHVPIIETDFALLPSIEEMLKYSTAKSELFNTLREGVVWRRKDDPSKSFKIRSPEYLVKG